ncbi:MAG: hypothetical protein ACFCUO_10950 [Rhodospirillales bacterium]
MTRLIFQYLLPLFLPAIAFLLWAWLSRQRHEKGFAGRIQEGPWPWLIAGGVVLVAAGLTWTALTSGGDATGRYVAPRLEDGRIIPGRIE